MTSQTGQQIPSNTHIANISRIKGNEIWSGHEIRVNKV